MSGYDNYNYSEPENQHGHNSGYDDYGNMVTNDGVGMMLHHDPNDPYHSQPYQDPYQDYQGDNNNGLPLDMDMNMNMDGSELINDMTDHHNNLNMNHTHGGDNGHMTMDHHHHHHNSQSDDASVGVSHDHDPNDLQNMIDFDNDPEIANLPRILMMGPRRGGKTSIQRVVFHKMSPHETLFRLEATQSLERSVVDHTPLCRFTIWDFPGDYYGPENVLPMHQQYYQQQQQQQHHNAMNHHGMQHHGMNQNMNGNGGAGGHQMGMNPNFHHQQSRMMRQSPVHATHNETQNQDPHDLTKSQSQQSQNNGSATDTILQQQQEQQQKEKDEGDNYVFGKATALIFVLDAQDEPYDHVLQHFTETVKRAARVNPHIAIEVFINKVDGELFLSDEAKYDCRRDVMQQVTDELADAGVMPDSVPISYHLTSIYDHSVFEAFSRVVQKLIPNLQPTLENLLNVLVSTCAMEKAYLFDVASKLYISTDSSPVDMQSVELCSDMIDCVLDVSGIYGLKGGGDDNEDEEEGRDDVNDGSDELSRMNSTLGVGSALNNTSGLNSGIGGPGGPDIDSSTGAPGSEPLSINSSDPAFTKHNESKLSGVGHGHPMGNNHDNLVDGVNVNAIVGGDFLDYDLNNDGNDELVGTLISQSAGGMVVENESVEGKEKEVDADSAYDEKSASVIRLSKGMVCIVYTTF